MRAIFRSAVLLVLVALTSCSQVEPVILTVSMPDCTFRGATMMKPGEASLSLSLNGLGSARAKLVELTGGHTYDELTVSFDQEGDWDNPDWLRTVIDLELSDTDGVDGVADSSDLGEGEYAVVCVDTARGTARMASSLAVVGG